MKNKAFHFLLLGVLKVGLLQLADCDKIRVVGPSRCSGRVEVFYDNSWGTVCDDYWSLNNADVVCRELNCGTALEATSRAFFGEGKNNIHLDDVKCEGTESSLSKCPHRELGENNCGHGEDAGVICSEHLRLVNGTDRCSGRVEVYHGGHWKKLCDNNWTSKEANVVCRELTCGTPSKDNLNFGQQSGKNGVRSNCYGNESSLAQCPIEAFNDTCVDATVHCKNVNMVRLANGTSRCSGRVEVFHNAQWGTVCDDRWGMQDATVTCQEVSCGQPLAVKYRAFFGEGNGQVWMDDVECNGNEKSITECTHRGFGENDCGHAEDASVICSDTIRLANGTDRCNGRVEFFHNDEWVKLCSNDWSLSKAAILCNELQCGNPFNPQVKPYFGESNGLRGFTSRCVGNETSFADCQLQHNPAMCENVALTCKGQLQVKLLNGTDRCSGRVEVYHDGQWGTVCDDQWDLNDAQVVCREVDCGTARSAKTRGFFGKGEGEIWLDDMECVGHEMALDACPHNTYGDNNCGHAEDAGVICSSTIRLYNGTDHCSGRLEVYHGGQWLPVYDSGWGTRETGVVCREMDCGDAVAPLATSSVHVPYTGQRGYTVSCQGTETSVTQCSLREYVKTSRDNVKEATVACTGTVKLVNGSNRCAGRVEFYRNGQWGKVCGDSWDMNDAQVACAQLSCGRAHKVLNTDEFGLGGGKTWIESIECNGRESSLSQCVQTEDPTIACNHSSVASVICSDNLDVRLVGAADHCSGRVEVLHGEQWGTLCEHGWTMNEAELVCKVLECGKAVSAPGGAHFGQGTGPVWEASQACFSSEKSLHHCTIKGFNATRCTHEEDAGVVCAEQLRLVNGRGQCSGRVEVFHKGLWGTVCDDEWEMANAEVVCRQVGCGVAISALTSAHYGRGDGPIWLDNVECTGSESALTQCAHNAFGDNNCGHGEDAGVVCLGSLPKPQITVSPGPEVRWGERVEITCMMMTEHLGGTFVLQKTPGTYRQEKYTDNEAAVFIIPKVDYSHKGSYHCEYRKRLATQNIEFPLGDAAELSVTVMLETPSISLTSPHAMVIFSPDNLEVNQGSSFSITCSIHSQYLGGFFYLTTSKSNVSEPKPVFSHSVFLLAYFDFPAVEYKDQGEYRCVYGVNISTLTFRSEPSKSLRITVIASSVSPAVSGVLGGLLVLLLLLGGAYLLWRKRHQIGRASVRFSSRVGELREAAKEDTGANKGHVAFDGRDFNSIVNEQGNNLEDKSSDADSSNTVDRNATEDLTGRVCYELEPLIHDS